MKKLWAFIKKHKIISGIISSIIGGSILIFAKNAHNSILKVFNFLVINRYGNLILIFVLIVIPLIIALYRIYKKYKKLEEDIQKTKNEKKNINREIKEYEEFIYTILDMIASSPEGRMERSTIKNFYSVYYGEGERGFNKFWNTIFKYIAEKDRFKIVGNIFERGVGRYLNYKH